MQAAGGVNNWPGKPLTMPVPWQPTLGPSSQMGVAHPNKTETDCFLSSKSDVIYTYRKVDVDFFSK